MLAPQSWPFLHEQSTELPQPLVWVPGLQPLQVGVGHTQDVPLHTLPLPHEHVLGVPHPLSIVPHELVAHVFAVMQVPALQHCEPPHDEHVTGAFDLSGLTEVSPGSHIVWCWSPLQSLPHAAGGVQQCAPLTVLPAPSLGTTGAAPPQPHVYCTPHESVFTSKMPAVHVCVA